MVLYSKYFFGSITRSSQRYFLIIFIITGLITFLNCRSQKNVNNTAMVSLKMVPLLPIIHFTKRRTTVKCLVQVLDTFLWFLFTMTSKKTSISFCLCIQHCLNIFRIIGFVQNVLLVLKYYYSSQFALREIIQYPVFLLRLVKVA